MYSNLKSIKFIGSTGNCKFRIVKYSSLSGKLVIIVSHEVPNISSSSTKCSKLLMNHLVLIFVSLKCRLWEKKKGFLQNNL